METISVKVYHTNAQVLAGPSEYYSDPWKFFVQIAEMADVCLKLTVEKEDHIKFTVKLNYETEYYTVTHHQVVWLAVLFVVNWQAIEVGQCQLEMGKRAAQMLGREWTPPDIHAHGSDTVRLALAATLNLNNQQVRGKTYQEIINSWAAANSL